jgi:hypothetical protein
MRHFSAVGSLVISVAVACSAPADPGAAVPSGGAEPAATAATPDPAAALEPSLGGDALSLDAFLQAVTAEFAGPMAAVGTPPGSVGFVVEPMTGALADLPLARYLADQLSMALAAADPALQSVVDRRERAELFEALGEQSSELFDPETTVVLGKWLGHRWAVSGHAYARRDGVEIALVATDLQTGRTLRTAEGLDVGPLQDLMAGTELPSTKRVTARIGWEVEVPDVEAEAASANDFWSLGAPRGTEVRFTLSVDEDAHALVFARRPSGRGLLLMPNGRATTTALAAGQVVTVPARDLDALTLDGASGQEEFFVVVSPEPLHTEPNLAEVLGSPRLQPRGGELRIDDASFVSAQQTAAWIAVLDELEAEGKRWRGALEAAERMAAGERPATVAARDLGNPVVAPRQKLTSSRAVQHAEITSSGLTVVRFAVDLDAGH